MKNNQNDSNNNSNVGNKKRPLNQIAQNTGNKKAKKTPITDTKKRKAADQSNPPKKKRKKKNDGERAFRPGQGNRRKQSAGSKKNILAMRSRTEKVFTDEQGTNHKVRITFTIDGDVAKKNFHAETNKEKLIEKLQEKILTDLKGCEPFRKIVRVVEQNAKGSPTKVEIESPTDKKTYILTRVERVKPYSFYSNLPDQEQFINEPKSKPLTPKRLFEANKHMVKNDKDFKIMEVEVTKKSLRAAEKNIDEKGAARNQNAVMAPKGKPAKNASAQHYAKTLGLVSDDENAEHLHSISFKTIGHEAQIPENLVVGSAETNTLMIYGENRVDDLAELGFKYKVTAKMHKAAKEKSQAAESILREMILEFFTHAEDFMGFSKNKPHIAYDALLGADIKAKLEYVAENKLTLKPNQPFVTPKKSHHKFPFFDRTNLMQDKTVPVYQSPVKKKKLR